MYNVSMIPNTSLTPKEFEITQLLKEAANNIHNNNLYEAERNIVAALAIIYGNRKDLS